MGGVVASDSRPPAEELAQQEERIDRGGPTPAEQDDGVGDLLAAAQSMEEMAGGQTGDSPEANSNDGTSSPEEVFERPKVVERPTHSSHEPFELNSQSLAGLAFFIALGVYRNKDVAMAFALSLEAALYWKFYARRRRGRPKAVTRALLPRGNSSTSSKLLRGGGSRRKSRLQQAASGQQLERPTGTPQAASKRRASDGGQQHARKRHRGGGKVGRGGGGDARLPSLHAGMAVLLPTTRRGIDGWDRSWSLGRVLRIITARQTLDVVWLKPHPLEAMKEPLERMLARRWVAWTLKREGNEQPVEWQSKGLPMARVVYGVYPNKEGMFLPEDQAALAAQIARLEAPGSDFQSPGAATVSQERTKS